jgi:DNA-directed RNA polymerase alpha subunit
MAGDGEVTHRERKVLSDILMGWSVESIANEYGLTRERIRQIAYKAVRKAAHLINYNDVVQENDRLKNELSVAKIELTSLRSKLSLYEMKDAKKTVDNKLKKLLATNVRELNVSVRLLNCFTVNNVYTLADAVRLRKSDYLSMRNFGKKSLIELEKLLESNGLSLGMDV